MTRPGLDPGLTLLRTDSPQSTVIHRIVGAHLAGNRGPAYWIDARNVASTHALYECVPDVDSTTSAIPVVDTPDTDTTATDTTDGSRRAATPAVSATDRRQRVLAGLQVARAFTAYQHHALVERATRRVTEETVLIVAPNVASLYRDDDLPEWEQTDLLRGVVDRLAAASRARNVPVLVTTADGPTADALAGAADVACEVVRTREGFRLAGDGAPEPTAGYWHAGYWQTTIPYWVDLLGAVESFDRGRDPTIAAADRGLLDVEVTG